MQRLYTQIKMFAVALLLLAVVSTSADFPMSTNNFISDLQSCPGAAQTDIDCINAVVSGLQKAQKLIQDVHDVKTKLQTLNNALGTVKAVLLVVDFIPAIGQVSKAFEQVVNTIKPAVDSAYNKASAIDSKLWPYKPTIDSILTDANRATSALATLKQKCTDGTSYLTSARNCVNSMATGSVKSNLGAALESFAGSIDPPTRVADQAMSTVGSTCSTIRTFATLPWPDLGFIAIAMDAVQSTLNPILSGLQSIQSALSQQVCIPNPIEVAEEGVEHTKEVANEAAERASEAARKINPSNWGWGRRKRNLRAANLQDISVSREDSHQLLKRNICLSVQGFLNGASSFLNLFEGPINAILQPVLNALPKLSLPGLPDFSQLLNFNFNINIPNFDFGLDFNIFGPFVNLNFQCAISIQTSCSSGATLSSSSSTICGWSLASYATTTTTTTTTEAPLTNWGDWNWRGWSFWKRLVRSVTENGYATQPIASGSDHIVDLHRKRTAILPASNKRGQ